MSKQVNVKAYPKDFKEQVVKLAQVGDRSATQIAREFEISRESVRRWVKQAELDQGSRTDGLRSKDQDELARLRPSSRRAQENAILSGRIAEIHEQSQGIYGSRRVHAELRAQGVVISWQRVARPAHATQK